MLEKEQSGVGPRRGQMQRDARPAAKTVLTAAAILFKSEKPIRDHHKCKRVKPSRIGTCAERAVHRKGKRMTEQEL